MAFQLMVFVYQNCEDDVNTFTANCKNVRPVQMKEMRDQLSTVEKNTKGDYLIKLFDKVMVNEAKAQPEKSPTGR